MSNRNAIRGAPKRLATDAAADLKLPRVSLSSSPRSTSSPSPLSLMHLSSTSSSSSLGADLQQTYHPLNDNVNNTGRACNGVRRSDKKSAASKNVTNSDGGIHEDTNNHMTEIYATNNCIINTTANNSGAHDIQNSDKTIKCNNKWRCPQCQSDVRRPPISKSMEAIGAIAYFSDDYHITSAIEQEKQALKNRLDLITVVCSLPGCPAPRYHVSKCMMF